MENIQRILVVDDIELRRAEDGGRVLLGRALRYGTPYEVTDDGGRSFYHEVWRAGVFTRSLQHRGGVVPLHWHHDRQSMPYGSATMSDSTSELLFRAQIAGGDRGDEMLELIEMGAIPGVSVGARPIRNEVFRSEGVERVEAAIKELSLTAHAQIEDGEILAMRACVELEAPAEPVGTPTLDLARQQLESITPPWEN